MRPRHSIVTAAAEMPAALCVFDVRALPIGERKNRLRAIQQTMVYRQFLKAGPYRPSGLLDAIAHPAWNAGSALTNIPGGSWNADTYGLR